jgi:hypothetical protein
MRKTIEELRKLNTKNLLRFYKAERNRMFNRGYRYMVIDEDENCNPVMGWDNSSSSDTFNDDIDFLCLIKTELNTREHVS